MIDKNGDPIDDHPPWKPGLEAFLPGGDYSDDKIKEANKKAAEKEANDKFRHDYPPLAYVSDTLNSLIK